MRRRRRNPESSSASWYALGFAVVAFVLVLTQEAKIKAALVSAQK